MEAKNNTASDRFIPEKLYSPLFVNIVADDNLEHYDGEYWNDPISQYVAAFYTESIHEALLKERDRSEDPRGLMTYYRDGGGVDEKVHSLYVDVEEHDGKLWGVATLELKASLSLDELIDLKDYLSGQYSDGFGEGFEQRGIRVSDGELYVSLWDSSDRFFIDTSLEFERRLGLAKPLVERPAAALVSKEKAHGSDAEGKPSVIEQLRRAQKEAKDNPAPRKEKSERDHRGPAL